MKKLALLGLVVAFLASCEQPEKITQDNNKEIYGTGHHVAGDPGDQDDEE